MPDPINFSLMSFRTLSMRSAGRICRTRITGGSARRGYGITGLNDLTDFVLQHRLDDVPTVFLAPNERLRELDSLFRAHFTRHRRLIGIYHGLHHRRPAVSQRFLENAGSVA